MVNLLSSILILFICISTLAQPEIGGPESFSSFESAFQAGVKNYQDKKYSESKVAFTKALEFDSTNISTLTNLALVYFQLGEKGYAVALLRKATSIDPDFSTSNAALHFILPQLEMKEIPHEIQIWETLRTSILNHLSLFSLSLLSALFLLATGWTLIPYLGQWKNANENEAPLPSPSFLNILFTLGFLIFFSGLILKWLDQKTERGTIVASKIQVLSTPDEKAPPLFDLYGGLEVIVKDTNEKWSQVYYPGGLTGWVPNSALLITTGK